MARAPAAPLAAPASPPSGAPAPTSAEGGAISYNDVLSVPFALDALLPQLEEQFPG